MYKCISIKKLISTLSIILFSGISMASEVDSIYNECQRQMDLGICTVQIDASKYDPKASLIIPGVGRIPLVAYIRIRNADKEMCNLARQHCTTYPSGDECKVAKSFWKTPTN